MMRSWLGLVICLAAAAAISIEGYTRAKESDAQVRARDIAYERFADAVRSGDNIGVVEAGRHFSSLPDPWEGGDPRAPQVQSLSDDALLNRTIISAMDGDVDALRNALAGAKEL